MNKLGFIESNIYLFVSSKGGVSIFIPSMLLDGQFVNIWEELGSRST